MNTNKQLYKAPAAKILVVGFEDDLLIASYGAQGSAGAALVEDPEDVYDL